MESLELWAEEGAGKNKTAATAIKIEIENAIVWIFTELPPPFLCNWTGRSALGALDPVPIAHLNFKFSRKSDNTERELLSITVCYRAESNLDTMPLAT
jgi:hypothetical protein